MFGRFIKMFSRRKNTSLLKQEDALCMRSVVESNAMKSCLQTTEEILKPFSFEMKELQSDIKNPSRMLNENGLIILKEFIDTKSASNLAGDFMSVIQKNMQNGAVSDFENEDIYIDREGKKFNSYLDKAEFNKTIFTLRAGADKGMIDIFNYDHAFKKEAGLLRSIFSNDLILKLIQDSTGKSYRPKNLNIYYNQNVKDTRGFHVDSYSKGQIKAFLYLTDVIDTSYGPYSFVMGSHNDRSSYRINRAIAREYSGPKTDAFFFDSSKAYSILGKKGTMVISDQSGIHRGYPQETGKERIVAVMNYTSY